MKQDFTVGQTHNITLFLSVPWDWGDHFKNRQKTNVSSFWPIWIEINQYLHINHNLYMHVFIYTQGIDLCRNDYFQVLFCTCTCICISKDYMKLCHIVFQNSSE